MIGTGAFNYLNVLNKAADASWKRNEVISNNIANVDTPNYKRQDVQFESYLMEELAGGDSLDKSVANADMSALTATTYTDNSNLSYREDGNNVDIDTENSYLAQNQIKYYTVLDSMNQEFSRIKTVLTAN
ncbi:flagellar basal body rod protein FlgB [Anaeromicropila herbilytica]|uniref:Flagellar basal body rod protein FlgB n=1 Tax=Anaeromicropila herbilytica TaxID=2785025 RepID=A0A7R7EMH6_9FIRM|nr:flagellar basal body rod protein FlgB [Anaeromicropila herbilytica]BCN31539.1 flagellar basal body rod protein FlgB [Anaeromicropila herbilytica]